MGDEGHNGPGKPEKRLVGLDDGPIRFHTMPVFACTWLLTIFVEYPLPSERPDNAVAFSFISWNGSGQILIFARLVLTALLFELETQ